MLFKRIAKIKLKQKIEIYLSTAKNETLPSNLAVKNAFKKQSKQELLQDLIFYIHYCLDNTVNPDKEFIQMLQQLLQKCRKKDKKKLLDILVAFK